RQEGNKSREQEDPDGQEEGFRLCDSAEFLEAQKRGVGRAARIARREERVRIAESDPDRCQGRRKEEGLERIRLDRPQAVLCRPKKVLAHETEELVGEDDLKTTTESGGEGVDQVSSVLQIESERVDRQPKELRTRIRRHRRGLEFPEDVLLGRP